MKTFFIADLHFGHRAIMTYENRSFETVKEMDEVLIANWNRVVRKQDKVYLLGDISFYKDEVTAKLIKRLKITRHMRGKQDCIFCWTPVSNNWYERWYVTEPDFCCILRNAIMISRRCLVSNCLMAGILNGRSKDVSNGRG